MKLSCFSFFVIGWIHQSLHSFNCGAFQALIRITVQMVEDAQGECIERCPAQFFDQLRLAGARCTRDHNHVASPTALVAPPSFRRLSPHPRQSCMSEVLHTCAYVFERYSRVSLQVLSVLVLSCSGVEQKHQSLFNLMKFSFLSAEVEPHIEPFFQCVLKGWC